MKVIESSEIEKTRWDQLVSSEETVPYDYSWYLDAVAEKWYLYVDEQYSKGIAFSTSTRLGIENITIPPFVRENRFYGNWNEKQKVDFFENISKRFSGGIIQSNFNCGKIVRQYQITRKINLSKHAKRNINKAKRCEISSALSNDIEPAFSIMVDSLSQKIKDFDLKHQQLLLRLFKSLQANNKLIIRNILKDGNIIGGLFFFKGKQRDLYIKGGANSFCKHNGGMYLAMNEQIIKTLSENKIFDFDGSEVPGVKRFNEYFGTEDMSYYQKQWDNNPLYYRIIRKIYLLLK